MEQLSVRRFTLAITGAQALRLTVNLGLRWDGVPHTYEANKRSSDFYPNLYNPANAATFDSAGNLCSGASDPGCTAITPGLVNGLRLHPRQQPVLSNGIGIGGVTPGVPRGLAENQWNAWGPRLGFSYDVKGEENGGSWRLRRHVRAHSGQRHV